MFSHGVRSWSGPGAAKPFASKAVLCCLEFNGSFPGGNSIWCSIQAYPPNDAMRTQAVVCEYALNLYPTSMNPVKK